MKDRLKFRVWNNALGSYDMNDHYLNEDGELSCKGDYVVEQCAGLKDKNGVLIYEGDLLKAIKILDMPVIQCKRYDDSVCFVFDALGYARLDFSDYTLEVIGNIHENKELLND